MMILKYKMGQISIVLAAMVFGTVVISAQTEEKPNVVFFLVDDLGLMDLSCYGSDFHESPNIDRLASEGVRFINAYASHPVCGPSRTGIATGCFPSRLGVTGIGGQIPAGRTIWPKVLKEAGYTTWFGGKWHMGSEKTVTANGFDYNVTGCKRGQPADFYYPYKGVPASQNVRGLEDGKPGDYLTDALTDRAIAFLDKHGKEPFLLYFSYYNVHKPANPLGHKKGDPTRRAQGKKEHVAYFKKKLKTMPNPEREFERVAYGDGHVDLITRQRDVEFAAQIMAVDDSIGRVMAKLRELGVEDNTVVIFTADQGSMASSSGMAVSSSAPYRFGKGFLYEGGVRAPFIVKAPGVTKPGSLNKTVTVNTDIYPTVLDLLGLDLRPKEHEDGMSMLGALKGKTVPFERPIYWAYPSNHTLGHKASVSIREGVYKLIYWPKTQKTVLYNVEKDLAELNDLSQSHPELAERLKKRLENWGPMVPILEKF